MDQQRKFVNAALSGVGQRVRRGSRGASSSSHNDALFRRRRRSLCESVLRKPPRSSDNSNSNIALTGRSDFARELRKLASKIRREDSKVRDRAPRDEQRYRSKSRDQCYVEEEAEMDEDDYYDDDYDEGIEITDETSSHAVRARAPRGEQSYRSQSRDRGYVEEDPREEEMEEPFFQDGRPAQNIDGSNIEDEYNYYSSGSGSIGSLSSDNSLSTSEISSDEDGNPKRMNRKEIAARQAALEEKRERERRERQKEEEARLIARVQAQNRIRETDLGFAKYRRNTRRVRHASVPRPEAEKDSEWIKEEKPRVSLKGLRIKAWDSMGRNTRPPRPHPP